MGNYIVCFSPTETTKKVTKAIADGLGGTFELLDCTLTRHRNQSLFFTEKDLVIIGAPVYAGRIPEVVESYYRQIEGGKAKVIPVVVYGNRHYDDALLELSDLCQAVGFKTIAAAAFIGEHSYTDCVAGGRPDKEDLNKAVRFGQSIDLNHRAVEIPGNRPYRELQKSLPIAPSTKDCSGCGACVKLCPVDAISPLTFLADENKCIKCHVCVKHCDSKYFDERLDRARTWLKDNYSIRREPEIFK